MADGELGLSATHRVIEALIEGLRDGRYAPGQRLVSADLAAELGVSRAPVREAFHLLAGSGVLVLLPNRGARFRVLTRKDIADLAQVLRALWSLTVDLAVPRIAADRALQAQMRKQLDHLLAVARQRQSLAWFRAVSEYFAVLVEIADNPHLAQVFGSLPLPFVHRALADILPGPHWEQYVRNYTRLGRAVCAGDADVAKEAFDTHMGSVLEILASLQR